MLLNSYVEVNGHRPDQSGIALMLNALSRSLDSLASYCLTMLLQATVSLSDYLVVKTSVCTTVIQSNCYGLVLCGYYSLLMLNHPCIRSSFSND